MIRVRGVRRRESLAIKIVLLWAGLSLGVAFLATPAKFLAAPLTLPVALEVGQQTFKVYNWAQLVLLILVAGAAAAPGRRAAWTWRLLAPAVILGLQAFWLIPALDLRVAMIQAGGAPPASNLHILYVALEAVKVIWLLAIGLGDEVFPGAQASRASEPAT